MGLTLLSTLQVSVAATGDRAEDRYDLGKPNIVLFFADDAGYHDFGFQGSAEFRTPHLDELAARSIRFTSAYTTAAVCGPSRAGLLKPKYERDALDWYDKYEQQNPHDKE